MGNVTVLKKETRGFLVKLTSEFDDFAACTIWTAEIHKDLPQGTEKIGTVLGSSRERALENARGFVDAMKQPPSEPEWVRLDA